MTTFAAGRFRADAYLGPQNGEVTRIIQTHANGSEEVVGEFRIQLADLLDLKHVLDRAIRAHRKEWPHER